MIAAMDRATDPNNDGRIDDRVDAINLSIGADFASSPATAQAASRMVRAGIAVAISAGNSGDVPFVTGSPAAAERVLGVASSSAPKPLYGLLTEPPPQTIFV